MNTRVIVRAVDYANVSIGRDLRLMRERAGLSQIDVARAAKMQPAMLCRIESGKGNPTIDTVARIARAIERMS